MSITLKRLTPELCEDFLSYFDNVAFSDHEDWAFCYCLECHLDRETQENTAKNKPLRRKMAKNFVNTGVMQGYLAYDGEQTAIYT